MSSLNDIVLITFEELKHLQIEDISLCVDKYSALSICEKSSAPPSETYNLWVQKLFKAYDIEEFLNNDWHKIISYLEEVLNNFVKNVDPLDDTSLEQLNLWWSDTHELLKWLESVINTLDICILSLILTFVLEIIVKTCKFTNKRNLKPILTIQQLVIRIINNFLPLLSIQKVDDFEGFNKILSSICDVGSLISSADIKTSIETWRVVAKLSGICHSMNSSDIQTETTKNLQCDWLKKAIFGILKELTKILKSLLDLNSCSNNDNILQVAQFYLKLLKVIINHSSEKIYEFPAIEEFFKLYTLCNHQLAVNYKSKIDLFINKDLCEIFSLIQHQPKIKESILQHFKQDLIDFNSCDLIVNYLQIIIGKSWKDLCNIQPDIAELLNIYDTLFKGSLIFVDGDKYFKILEYYVALTIQDVTNELHKKLCQYVVDSSSWIKAYASAEILGVYYSYLFKNQSAENNLPCLEFWIQIWNKFNNYMPELPTQKILIELLLKTILHKIPDQMILQQYFNNLENVEIITLICDKEYPQSLQYFQTKLIQNLTKMQECRIDNKEYRELINLLEICVLKPSRITLSLRVKLIKTFQAVFSIPPLEMNKLREFLNKCFRIFINLDDSNINNSVLQCLMDNLPHTENIWSVFLIEYLLKHKPQSTEILQTLNSVELTKILNLMDYKSLPIDKKPIDLKKFQNLSYDPSNSSCNNEISPITKKPRLGECKFSNIKFILNEMNLHTQHLMKIDSKLMDSKDVELLNCIKNNIENCLTK